jgi:hypothetical protein
MASGTAADVGDPQPADFAKKCGEIFFLERDQRIAVAIVQLRPAVVALASVDDLDARSSAMTASF